jgi:hypothetical protein
MMSSPKSKLYVERCAWIFIYAGLLGVVLSVFLQRQDRGLADVVQIGGTVVAATGAGLIWIRSRMQ